MRKPQRINSTSLYTLPPEILELIAGLLEVRDIGSLRLGGRSIACKVSYGHYRTYFRKKAIPLRVESLTTFSDILRTSSLVSLLEDATIVGIVSTDVPEQDLVESLLTKAFVTLKEKAGGLRSLGFRIIWEKNNLDKASSDDIDNWDEASSDDIEDKHFAITRDIFKATMIALQKSRLSIRDLNMFGNLPSYSVSIDLFGELLHPARLNSSLEDMKCFSLGLTGKPFPSQDLNNLLEPDTFPGENVDAVARLLNLMKSLEELDIRWYMHWSASDTPESFFLNSCFKSINSSTLKCCSFRGIYVTEATLRNFLQQTSAKRVTLQEVHIWRGTFTSILDILTSRTGNFSYFHLDDLYQEERPRFKMLHFKVPGKPKFPMGCGGLGPSEIVREGDEVAQKLDYTFATGRPLGSPQGMLWRQNRVAEYGIGRKYVPDI